MRSSIKAALVVAWLTSVVACAFVGRAWGISWRDRHPPSFPLSGSPLAPTVIRLPANPFLQVQSPSNPKSRVNIFAQYPEFGLITSATVFSGAAGDCNVSFYEGSGQVKSILVLRNGEWYRDWDFREDGSIQAVTTYKDRVGTKQEFDSQGNPTKTSTMVIRGT